MVTAGRDTDDEFVFEQLPSALSRLMAERAVGKMVTFTVSVALVAFWALREGFDWGLTVVLEVLLCAVFVLVFRLHRCRIIIHSETSADVVRPAVSYNLVTEAIIGLSLVAGSAYFVVATSVAESGDLLLMISFVALFLTILLSPVLLLVSSIPRSLWLKSVINVRGQGELRLTVLAVSVLDRALNHRLRNDPDLTRLGAEVVDLARAGTDSW